MRSLILGVLALCFAAETAFAAQLDAERRAKLVRCRDADAKDALDACVLAQPGVKPVGELTKSGQSVLRAFLSDGEGRPRLFIQFTEQSGDVALDVRGPFSETAIVQRRISPHAWSGLLDRWANFDDAVKQRSDERKKHEDEIAKSGQEVICLHGWGAIVESNIGNLPSVMMPEACDDQPGRFDLVDDMLAIAMQFAPECAALKPEYFGYEALRFNRCGSLHGDRVKAAAVLNCAWQFNTIDLPQATDADLARLVSPQAIIRFDGGAPSVGAHQVVKAWRDAITLMPHLSFDISDVTATRHVVTVRGTMYFLRTTQPSPEYWAPFEQRWHENGDGTFLLVDWDIGKFVAQKD